MVSDATRSGQRSAMIQDKAAAPIMADEMKPAVAVPHGLNDVERIANQLVDPVVVELGGVRPRVGGIAALVRRHDEAACRRERRDLVVPEMPRHAEPVQHQHQWCRLEPGDGGIENHSGRGLDVARFDHRSLRGCRIRDGGATRSFLAERVNREPYAADDCGKSARCDLPGFLVQGSF